MTLTDKCTTCDILPIPKHEGQASYLMCPKCWKKSGKQVIGAPSDWLRLRAKWNGINRRKG